MDEWMRHKKIMWKKKNFKYTKDRNERQAAAILWKLKTES